MACRGNYNTTHCCSNSFTGETTTLHIVAAMVLQVRLQYYTLSVAAVVIQGTLQHYTTQCCSSGFTGETTMLLHSVFQQWFYRGHYNTTHSVLQQWFLQGTLQHYTLSVAAVVFTGETTTCYTLSRYSSGFTGETTTLHNVAAVVYTEGRLQHYTVLRQWFAGETTTLHTFAAVVCRGDYNVTHFCSSSLQGRLVQHYTLLQQ